MLGLSEYSLNIFPCSKFISLAKLGHNDCMRYEIGLAGNENAIHFGIIPPCSLLCAVYLHSPGKTRGSKGCLDVKATEQFEFFKPKSEFVSNAFLVEHRFVQK